MIDHATVGGQVQEECGQRLPRSKGGLCCGAGLQLDDKKQTFVCSTSDKKARTQYYIKSPY